MGLDQVAESCGVENVVRNDLCNVSLQQFGKQSNMSA